MLLAAKSNNLTSANVQPWHLKASFTALDENGKTTDQGAYEELWAGRAKYKRTYTGTALTQIEYGTEKGIFRAGPHTSPQIQALVQEIHRELAAPLPSTATIESASFESQSRETGGAKLTRLRIMEVLEAGQTFCLDADKPVLRISFFPAEETEVVHNMITFFQGNFIAGDLQFVHTGKLALTAQLQSIEALNPISAADFVPTPGAWPVPRRINISAGVAQGMLLKNTAPELPPDAKFEGIQGTAVLQALIGIDWSYR
jgi:hypothetical protein